MKHVGILADSFEGATLCYRTLCLEGTRRLGPHLHPEITLTGIAMHHMMDGWERGDYPRGAGDVPRRRRQAGGGRRGFLCLPGQYGAHCAREPRRIVRDLRPAYRRSRRRGGGKARAQEGWHPWNGLDDDRSRLSGSIGTARDRLGDPGRERPKNHPRHHFHRAYPRHYQGFFRAKPMFGSSPSWPTKAATRWLWSAPKSPCSSPLTSRLCQSSIPRACWPRRRLTSRLATRPMPSWRGGEV